MHDLFHQALLHDEEAAIQEQTLAVLRNLGSGTEDHVDELIQWASEDGLLSMVYDPLTSEVNEVVKQALYIVVNVATGTEAHKAMVMAAEGLALKIAEHLTHPSSDVRLAAVWCVINLTSPNGNPGPDARVSALHGLGCREKLRMLVGDSEVDVEERVQGALSRFNAVVGHAVGGAKGRGVPGNQTSSGDVSSDPANDAG